MTFPPMVFLDLETTGATATRDRITEVGLVELSDQGVHRYSQLVNPEARIPEFIEGLTGITNEMVAQAPVFAEIADDLLARLQGKLFVAHNARFDYGFLKNEFKRLGIDFRARVLCTVKLSRELYPTETRHNLDALIARHGLKASGRHRALADAELIAQFWEKICANFSQERIDEAVARVTARPSLPSHLDPDLPDQIPETHGVYIFYGDQRFPLYVGKSNNQRKRVMSHFAADHSRGKEMSLAMQVKEVEWIETPGEIAALLKESALVKSLLPSHNTRLRRNHELCSWRLPPHTDEAHHASANAPDANESLTPELVWARDLNLGAQPNLFGLFRSQREAYQMLADLAQSEKLCKALLGLEKVSKGSSCFGFQLKQCKGACLGHEPPRLHHARLLMALAKHRIPVWPHAGPVGLREAQAIHLVDHWCYLGTANSEEEFHEILADGRPMFDLDVFKILQKAMRTLEPIVIPKPNESS